jgi:hypothetical protein
MGVPAVLHSSPGIGLVSAVPHGFSDEISVPASRRGATATSLNVAL